MMPTLVAASARRRGALDLPRSATAAPWNSSTEPCIIPTYDGSGSTIHPSVVDMVAETGHPFGGYRWWMANTPYPNGNDSLENPCVWGSNDRRNWEVPAGVTNPFDPFPGSPWFHSDTELYWDPDGQQLVCYYRIATQSTSPSTIYIRAATSPDGAAWTLHGTVLDVTGGAAARVSPALWRTEAGEWRMWLFGGGTMRTAPGPLGPWSSPTACTGLTGWHGDVIRHDGRWLGAYSNLSNKGLYLASSNDGVVWSNTLIATGGQGGGWDTDLYRPTLLPSTAPGFIDCWYSGYGSVPGASATDYVRLPESLWP